jgi:hypothetical protein
MELNLEKLLADISRQTNRPVTVRYALSDNDRQEALELIRKINDRWNHAPALGSGLLQK